MLIRNHFLWEFDEFLDPTIIRKCNFCACREADTLIFYLPSSLSISQWFFFSRPLYSLWYNIFIPGHRHKMMDSQTVTPLSLATKMVTRLPEFTSASNMSVVYTYTGGTAHIDCGVNLQGNTKTWVWEVWWSWYWEWGLFWIEDLWFSWLAKKTSLLTCQSRISIDFWKKMKRKRQGMNRYLISNSCYQVWTSKFLLQS